MSAAAISPLTSSKQRAPRKATSRLRAGGFILMHVACLAVFFTGGGVLPLALCAGVYLLQMFGITAGYHRYFSHRSYKTSRAFQLVLAWLGCSATQKGPLWWAAQHRHHHRTSDTKEDLHSPVVHGLWWSHIGWVLSPDSEGTDEQSVKDLRRYPELRWLDRYHWVPPLTVAGSCFLAGGWAGLVWGFFVGSMLSHQATFLVNSACHLWGSRRYQTADASRNNALVAVLTLGEGWHNNHHHYPSSANQGFRWWEVDVSYYVIRLLAAVGLVWGVRTPPWEKLLPGGPLPPPDFHRPRTPRLITTTAVNRLPVSLNASAMPPVQFPHIFPKHSPATGIPKTEVAAEGNGEWGMACTPKGAVRAGN